MKLYVIIPVYFIAFEYLRPQHGSFDWSWKTQNRYRCLHPLCVCWVDDVAEDRLRMSFSKRADYQLALTQCLDEPMKEIGSLAFECHSVLQS